MKKTLLSLIILSLLQLNGCCSNSSEESQKPPANKSEKLTEKEKLHNKAKITEAATLIGYDGKQIRQNLDKIIDANDKHNKMLEGLDEL